MVMLPFMNIANGLVLNDKWKEVRLLFLHEISIKNY